jgi:hypothetical protein
MAVVMTPNAAMPVVTMKLVWNAANNGGMALPAVVYITELFATKYGLAGAQVVQVEIR